MAKIIWKMAGPDDPIYNGQYIISSHNLPADDPDDPVQPWEVYPDLQNLPVDPAEMALKEIKKRSKK